MRPTVKGRFVISEIYAEVRSSESESSTTVVSASSRVLRWSQPRVAYNPPQAGPLVIERRNSTASRHSLPSEGKNPGNAVQVPVRATCVEGWSHQRSATRAELFNFN